MLFRALRGVWSILDPVSINVNVSPESCLKMLESASRPSSERLHLRDAFTEGRRYFIEGTREGFRLSTTSKTLFSRRRSEATALLNARVSDVDNGQTIIQIRARIRLVSLIYAFWVPVGMVFLLWPVPWPRELIVLILTVIFGFAWGSLHYGAALEANEMVFFIQKTFEDIPKFTLIGLPPIADNIIGGEDFDVMWERFVRTRQADS